MWGRPTLDVTGAWGGHTGRGPEDDHPGRGARHDLLPARAGPGREPGARPRSSAISQAHTPAGAALTIDWRLPGCWPVVVSAEHPAVAAALAAAEEGFGLAPAVYRAGYSVPIVELFARIVGLESVLLGFTLPDENMHAPNEFIRLDVFAGGVRTYAAFLDQPLPWPSSSPSRRRPAGGSSTCSSSARPSTPATGSGPASPR